MTKGTSFPRDNTVPKLLIISVKKKSLRNRLRPTDSNRAPPPKYKLSVYHCNDYKQPKANLACNPQADGSLGRTPMICSLLMMEQILDWTLYELIRATRWSWS
jgi:hypothetical protein